MSTCRIIKGLYRKFFKASPVKSKRTALQFEALESRLNMSVEVAVVGGDLFVSGDAGSDWVQLIRQANGATRVQGLNGTQVNGREFVDRFFNDDLFVDLGQGNNHLSMSNANGGIKADDVDIRTGSGTDWIDTNGLTALDDIVIDTGEGGDFVYLNYVEALDLGYAGEHGISVYTRGGEDVVNISNSFSAKDVTVILDDLSKGFDDRLIMDRVQARDDFSISGLGGNDSIYLTNLTVPDQLSVSLGAGNDFLKLTNCQARMATTFGGAGVDKLQYYNDSFMTTVGEAGVDKLQYYNDSFIPWTVSGFENYVKGP